MTASSPAPLPGQPRPADERPRSLTVLVGIHSPFLFWNIPAPHVERLRREFPSHRFVHATSDAETLRSIPDAQVAFLAELRPDQLAAAARLQWIHSPAAGVGGMLFPAMLNSPVVLTNSRGISAATIAEHVLAVTLAMFRKLPFAFRSQAAREWAQDAILAPPAIHTIGGSSVLIVGLGSIGLATAQRMAALGARVTGIRRDRSRPLPEGVDAVLPPEALLDALPHADIVVLAAPQTPQTRGLIGPEALAAMRHEAVLVNVGRGKLVDESALAAALTAGTIGGAALDVFDTEPLPADSPLWSMPNVLITPHMAGFRSDHWDAVTTLFAENLRRFAAAESLLNPVDKAAGY
jgi:phosphoglycerate dehydrogenase-like enzyme